MNQISNLNNKIYKINKYKLESEALLDIEKDKYNNLSKYIEEIKNKKDNKINELQEKITYLTYSKKEMHERLIVEVENNTNLTNEISYNNDI